MTRLATKRRSATKPPLNLALKFDDNSLLSLLLGEHDRHLVEIERRLGVTLRSRGNEITISGDSEAVEAAERTLNGLYSRLVQSRRDGGQAAPLDIETVKAAGRMALDGTAGGLMQLVDPAAGLVTWRHRIRPRTPAQAAYLEMLDRHPLVFALGPAGTGKTYLAVAAAVAALRAKQVDRLVLSRPAVEAGERLGFLPGDMNEKVDPYLRPLYDALRDTMSQDQMEKRRAADEIEVAPLAFMRGRTLEHSFVIVDEAQNTTPTQMKMLLTRLGEGSRMVVTGDLTQVDLPPGQPSGLRDALEVVHGLEGVGRIDFAEADVVRHPLVARIVNAYGRRDAARRDAGEQNGPRRKNRSDGENGAT